MCLYGGGRPLNAACVCAYIFAQGMHSSVDQWHSCVSDSARLPLVGHLRVSVYVCLCAVMM